MSLSNMSTARGSRDDAGAALVSVMLFVILLGGLSLVLLATMLGQIAPGFSAQTNTRTGYAAQAGLQAGVASLRASGSAPDADGNVFGDRAKLPCGFTGNVDSTAETIWYDVTFSYFDKNPTNESQAWRDANDLTCSTPGGVSKVPLYAVIESEAVSPDIANTMADQSQRAMSAIYQFKVTNVNIAGGRIFDGSGQYCMRAVSAKVGSEITYRAAADCPIDDPLAQWAYTKDYRIKLASTVAKNDDGLCMTGPKSGPSKTDRMELKKCLPAKSEARWDQLWNWTAGENFMGQNKKIKDGQSTTCISSGFSNGTKLDNQFVLARNGCIGSQQPESKVGSGGASKDTNQIVNFLEFGRCVDVTNEQLGSTYMILYPCKQDASGENKFLWNHKWFYDEPVAPATQLLDQEIFIQYKDSSAAKDKYCLQTPSNKAGKLYVTFVVCNSKVGQDWDRVYDTGVYDTSYLFIDKYGRCLTANSTPSDLHAGVFSKMTVGPCDGTLAQKWNAPPTQSNANFGGFSE